MTVEARPNMIRTIAAAALLVLISRVAPADMVHLENGDRLTGTVQSAAEGELVLVTTYAGELHVKLEEVKAVVTDAAVAVRRQDGEVLTGRLALEGDEQTLATDQVAQPLPLDQIEAIAADTESLPKWPQKERKWRGSVDAGASWRSAETDTLDANFGITLVRKRLRDTLTLELAGGYGEVDSQVNTRRLKGTAKYQYYLKERLYLYGHAGAEQDPGRRLELRVETGGGVGYDFIKSERRSLALDAGLDYAHEWWNEYTITELEDAQHSASAALRSGAEAYARSHLTKPLADWAFDDLFAGLQLLADAYTGDVDQITRDEDNVYIRLGGQFEQKLFESAVLTEKLVVLPQIDDLGEYRLTSDLALETPLSQKLSFRVNLLSDYDSDTTDGDDEFTNTLIAGLRYAF